MFRILEWQPSRGPQPVTKMSMLFQMFVSDFVVLFVSSLLKGTEHVSCDND